MFNLIKRSTLISIFFLSTYIFSDLSGSDIFSKSAPGVVILWGESSISSGVIISKEGHILTNWHSVEGSSDLSVSMYGKYLLEDSVHDVRVLKVDKKRDLALLKFTTLPKKLHVVKLSRGIPRVGDEVHAIGHPAGELWSYTMGFISQHRRDYEWSYSEEENFLSDVYQMQTPIYSGNSGGPLLNKYGNLVGINTFKHKKEKDSLNYAITVEEIIFFLSH